MKNSSASGPAIAFKPVAVVRSSFTQPADAVICCKQGLKADNQARIIVFPEYAGGLKGLDRFSHIFVIYHLHRIRRLEIVTHPGPPSVNRLPKVGVFASRSQYRPNPIALRLVKLEGIRDNVITVRGLDAINGSPVIDIKPYIAGFDRPKEYTGAGWYLWLDR